MARHHSLSLCLFMLLPVLMHAGDPLAPVCPPDWTVEIILKYPQIRYPSALTCAPDGRLFIAEDPIDMEGPKDQPIDRILCWHPDGRLTVYATNLHCVFGLLYLDGKLYVNHAPKLSVFNDGGETAINRQDWFEYVSPRADGSLLIGAKSHIPANLRLGMDGFIYMAVGDAGIFGLKDRSGTPFEMRGGGVARFRPDGTRMEIFSSGTRNHPDLAINAEDECFTYDNTDDGLGWWTRVTHMIDGGFYGYPWDYKPRQPYTLWMMTEFGSGSGTGALAYNEDALPSEYIGNIFFCDFARQQVLRLKVKQSGGSYMVEQRVQINGRDFLTPGESEFRPTAMAVSPDGTSFYIADWNSYLAEVAAPLGRIFKVTFTGKHRPAPRPNWWTDAATGKTFTCDTKELADALKHPAQSVRLVAQRRLAERGSEVLAVVLPLLTNHAENFHTRAAALWTLDALDSGRTARTQIVSLLDDPDPALRSQAARHFGIRQVTESVNALRSRLRDDDQRARVHAATALGRIADPSAVPDLLAALTETNLFPRFAAFTALNRIGRAEPMSWKDIVNGLKSPDTRIREGTLFALRETWDEKLIDALSGAFNSIEVGTTTRASLIELLAAEAFKEPPWDGSWWGAGGNPASRPRPKRTHFWAGTPAILSLIRKGLTDPDQSVQNAALNAIAELKDTNAAPVLTMLLAKEGNAPPRKQSLAALGAIGGSAFSEELKRLVDESLRGKPSVQTEALLPVALAVVTDRSCGNDLIRLAQSSVRVEWRIAAIESLAKIRDSAAAQSMRDLVSSANLQVATAAARALGQIDLDTLEREAPKLLSDARLPVRQAVVQALAVAPGPAAAQHLRTAFGDPALRNDIIKALARRPNTESLAAYFAGLLNTDSETRDAAVNAVIAVEGDAIPILEKTQIFKSIPAAVLQRIKDGMRNHAFESPLLIGPLDPGSYDEGEIVQAALASQPYGRLGRWQPVETRPLTGRLRLGIDKPNASRVACVLLPLEMPKTQGIILSVEAGDLRGITLNGRDVMPLLYPAENGARRFREFATELARGRNLLLLTIGMGETAPLLSVSWTRSGARQSVTNASPEELTQVALTTTGNTTNGEALFYDPKTGCVRCHSIGGTGKKLGPALDATGAKLTRAQLIESILYPSKQILHGFQQVTITHKSGDTLTGLVLRDDTEAVSLMDSSGTTNTVRVADIQSRNLSNISLMPEGLTRGLTAQGFADLIGYLQALK
jgi:putative heme-binding domain-containing protein